MYNDIQDVFITDAALINLKITQLTLVRPEDDYDHAVYLDIKTNDKWEKLSYWSEMTGKEYELLEKTVSIETNKLISIIVSLNNEDQLICACFELLRREKKLNEQFREKL